MSLCPSFGIGERHATDLHPTALLLVGACKPLADTTEDRLPLMHLFIPGDSNLSAACQRRSCIITTISSSTQTVL